LSGGGVFGAAETDASITYDGVVKSLFGRYPSEPRIMSGAGAGMQNILHLLNSGLRRNDKFIGISASKKVIFLQLCESGFPAAIIEAESLSHTNSPTVRTR
jgi:hypothetical protein